MLFKSMVVIVTLLGILGGAEYQLGNAGTDQPDDRSSASRLAYGQLDTSPPPVQRSRVLPPSKTRQMARSPRRRVLKGAQLRLARFTVQGQAIGWRSSTPRVCKIKKGRIVNARKKGRCAITATAPETAELYAFSVSYEIRVVKAPHSKS